MSMKFKHSLLAASVAVAIASPMAVLATNGMNLEGYGPIATGMGGASMAYDNGVAAVMNNPATLGLMDEGSRLDLALGNLGPDITTNHDTYGNAKSTADSFYMPAVGYAKRDGQFTYGVGMSAQGGMGTEYGANTFMGAGTGEGARSEVGVGRLVAPIVYNVDKNLTVGGSIDYIWAGMDLKMAMGAGDIFALAGSGNVSGSLAATLPAFFAGANGGANDVARFDFSDDNDYTGEAKGDGFAGKLGFTYKLNNNLTVGATYHTETSLGDLQTGSATMTIYNDMDGVPTNGFENSTALTGEILVKDFQWPSTLGVGMSYTQDKWMIAADVKQINWSDVMAGFTMEFKPTSMPGQNLIMTLPQNWDDQTVINVGGAYKVSSATTVRAGINSSSNPVPDNTVNPLFPATIETHYTLGFGHDLNKESAVNFSLTIAPEVSVTNTTGASGTVTTTHAQTNWQLMYSQKF